MKETTIYIEGKPSKSGKVGLRQSFSKLFRSLAPDANIKVSMKGSDTETVKFFKNKADSLCLVDADLPPNNLDKRRKDLKVSDTEKESIFFMVQEMEAWFLSQPLILEQYLHTKKLKTPRTQPVLIPKPSGELDDIFKQTDKQREYKKVIDGTQLLSRLDVTQLKKGFEEVARLETRLNQ